MKKAKPVPAAPAVIVWSRTDPEELKRFDSTTKICTMNCSQIAADPRSKLEARYQCEDCYPVSPTLWTLQQGLDEARALSDAKLFGYFVSLAGGVLEKGQSHHDLDLVFCPRTDIFPQFSELVSWLTGHFGHLVGKAEYVDRVVFETQRYARMIDLTVFYPPKPSV